MRRTSSAAGFWLPEERGRWVRRSGCLGGLLLLVLAGCSSQKPEFAEVEGVVTFRKKPLAGVIVTFFPIDEGPEQQPFARGTTDSSGRYKLSAPDGMPGVIAGKNRIVINWPPPERRDTGPRPKPPWPPIPIRYTVVSYSPLVKEVKPGRQTIDLPLEP